METTLQRETVTWSKLQHDLGTVIDDAEDLLRGLAGDMGEKAKAARASLGKQLESAKVTYAQLQDRAVQQARVADRTIRTNPYQSIGVALAVGIVVGLLAGRCGE